MRGSRGCHLSGCYGIRGASRARAVSGPSSDQERDKVYLWLAPQVVQARRMQPPGFVASATGKFKTQYNHCTNSLIVSMEIYYQSPSTQRDTIDFKY